MRISDEHLIDHKITYANVYGNSYKKLEATLKEMITGDRILMEYKGKEPILAKNYARVVITTNSAWAIPAGLEERRFFVLEAKDTEMQNKAYFAAIAKQLNNGGYEALMHYLMNYKYEEDILRETPKTEALLEQKIHSLSYEEQWWFEMLKSGELPMQDGWTDICGTDHIFRSYYEHAKLAGCRYILESCIINTHILSRYLCHNKKLFSGRNMVEMAQNKSR